MKKLVLLFVAVFITAISANVFAQSTGTTPAPGATHEYTITPGNVANDITWTITKGDLTTISDAGTISASTAATTDITWADTVTVGDWYYVHVVEDDGSCTNEKVLPVQITASPFYLVIAATKDDQCYDGAVTVSLADPSTINYDHGNATISFTVTPSGLGTSYVGYSFDADIAFGSYTGTLDASNVSITAGNGTITSGTVTVSDNNAVTITYVVDNQTNFTNSDAADAQDYVATVTISNGEAANGVMENETDGTYVDDTSVARPNTSGISTN